MFNGNVKIINARLKFLIRGHSIKKENENDLVNRGFIDVTSVNFEHKITPGIK